MHLCFIDESGTPAKPGQPTPKTFVMAGIIVPDSKWHALRKSFDRLKKDAAYDGEVKWRFFAPGNSDAANPMRDWDQNRKHAFRMALFKALTEQKSIKLIACVCDCIAAYELDGIDSQDDLYFRTYKPLTERFQYFLQELPKTTGSLHPGMIVVDQRGSHDDAKMRLRHERLLNKKRRDHSSYANLVESLFFAPSHLSVGVQFADLVAGAVWRKYDHNDTVYFDQIRQSFRADPKGKIDGYGLVTFPNKGKKTPGGV